MDRPCAAEPYRTLRSYRQQSRLIAPPFPSFAAELPFTFNTLSLTVKGPWNIVMSDTLFKPAKFPTPLPSPNTTGTDLPVPRPPRQNDWDISKWHPKIIARLMPTKGKGKATYRHKYGPTPEEDAAVAEFCSGLPDANEQKVGIVTRTQSLLTTSGIEFVTYSHNWPMSSHTRLLTTTYPRLSCSTMSLPVTRAYPARSGRKGGETQEEISGHELERLPQIPPVC